MSRRSLFLVDAITPYPTTFYTAAAPFRFSLSFFRSKNWLANTHGGYLLSCYTHFRGFFFPGQQGILFHLLSLSCLRSRFHHIIIIINYYYYSLRLDGRLEIHIREGASSIYFILCVLLYLNPFFCFDQIIDDESSLPLV